MDDSAPAGTHSVSTSWLYRTLALTGIAVGIFVIAAGAFLLFWHPGAGHSAQQDCCKSMEGDMKKMMEDPKMPMNKGPMTSMPPMPGPSPMPGMPMPTPTP